MLGSGRAASLVGASGFTDRIRALLRTAPVGMLMRAPPARQAEPVMCTWPAPRCLTCLHTGDRSAEAVDVGGVQPDCRSVIVRDGYAGYGHLTNALRKNYFAPAAVCGRARLASFRIRERSCTAVSIWPGRRCVYPMTSEFAPTSDMA